MMKTPRYIGAVLTSLILAACQSSTVPLETTAVLVAPTAQVQQQLSAAVAKMLGIANVTLADNALIASSYLAIERVPRTDASGQLLQGRVLEKPNTFRLLIKGQACWLEHVNTGKRMLLVDARCRVSSGV
jgi:hypothetical protein